MKHFRGCVAAITGAGSGIGRALAVQLTEAGCAVAVSDINADGLAATVSAVKKVAGARVDARVLDVADRAAMHAWADDVAETFGGVNMVFNNAGVALGASIDGAEYDDLEWIMGINFWGVVYGTKAFLPHLKATREGHVVNISSIFGLIGVPSQGAYNATKFAVRGFTEALRQELDLENCGVSATSIHPGGIKTNIARDARFGDLGKMGVGDSGEDAAKMAFQKLFITTPERAAAVILRGVQKNSRRVLIGPDAHAVDLMARVLPSRYQWLVGRGAKLAFSG